jgi:hypothetical protein
MAWEQRNGNTYYYAKQRVGTKVKSIYLGTGPEAHQEHQRIQDRKQSRQEQEAWQEIVQHLDQLRAMTEHLLSQAGLHRKNYGPWRKKRAA